MSVGPIVVELADAAATEALGRALAPRLVPGMALGLQGDLGAGKTTLARGLLRALGVKGRIKSPTYALLEVYEVSSLYLYHFDFYRLTDPEEWVSSGFQEYFNDQAICLVEWPEKAAGLMPALDLAIVLEHRPEGRVARLFAASAAGERCLATLRPQLKSRP
ncbi:tRNA threonylcarbamoyladenosine biosynthesis protein TsaE [Burkholderiales bacterium]|nr:MAG: tRNA (adenosine(37)-N6)-threonylcarbamoyltransferase complex ATPase subunit type 1 TsaE [Burkholderiales bacterium]CAG0964765.1 tRNA threonylcarbamoyladenosine biosynthesis protein TsaE [Burkholderiales bacterium]